MKQGFIFFLMLQMFLNFSYAHDNNSKHMDCRGIKGLKLAIDFKPEGSKYVSKTITELYTSFRDDIYFTHLILDQSLFANGNIEVQFEILNNQKKTIKKYLFKKWITDKNYPNKKISKINITNFATLKLGSPYDIWSNLPSSKKSKVDRSKVPYDGKFHIGLKNQSPICTFDFKYGSDIENDIDGH